MHHQASAPPPSNPPKPQSTPKNSPADLRVPRGFSPEAESPNPEDERVAPWAPDSRFPRAQNDTISFVRNILLTNPLFPKFYADVVLTYAPKSNEAKILRPWYQKILEKVNWKDSSMANTKTCTHIKVTGVRCGSPALYGESFCYFHQRMHRGVRMPAQARLHPIALIEDEESIQAALMEVINALMRNTIDLKRATLILRALHIAVKNAHRVKFGLSANSMVREVPDYPEPERPPEPRTPTAEEIKALKVQMWEDYRKEQAAKAAQAAAKTATAAPSAATTTNVATARASGQPTSTLSNAKGSSAAKETTASTSPLPKHDFKPQPSANESATTHKPTAPAGRTEAPPIPPRKPAASATPAQAPKERKPATQRASAG
jgi:hypothetical protein